MRWQGYLRQNPVGWRWLAGEIAELKREIAKTRLGPVKKVPALDHYEWKAPNPIFYVRAKAEAKQKK